MMQYFKITQDQQGYIVFMGIIVIALAMMIFTAKKIWSALRDGEILVSPFKTSLSYIRVSKSVNPYHFWMSIFGYILGLFACLATAIIFIFKLSTHQFNF